MDAALVDEDAAVVGEWASLDEAWEHALVALAMGVDCGVREHRGHWVLEVERDAAAGVERELELYAEEQARPVGGDEPRWFGGALEPVLVWVMVLLACFAAQQRLPGLVDLGANSTLGLLEGGEWWRPFTALFLHADFEHLLGNVLIGGVFCLLVSGGFGIGRGWLLIFASGVLGNVATSLAHAPDPFRSIGASTATFGALGLLVGQGLVSAWRARHYRQLRGLIVPLGVGLALLGWFGAGGGDTDVLGHVFGWSAGVVLGAVVGWRIAVAPGGRMSD